MAYPAGGAALPEMPEASGGFDRERMKEVLDIKEQANGKFKEGDFFSAKCLYSGALELLERCCLHLEKADETWEGIKNNMALCDLKREEWSRVVETTTEILTRNGSNTKALYRRGVARIGQEKHSEAQRDLKLVLELDPRNADARQKLAEVSQHLRQHRSEAKDQAEKMRGFLRGERIDDTVAITEDGSVRKLHGNENAPLLSSWLKRAWTQPSGTVGVVTCHVVMRTPAGKEVWSSRKPPGANSPQAVGPHMANQPKPTQRPVEPARWVVDDAWGGVFQAWNAAAKSLQLRELGRFEAAKHTMGPSVEGAVEGCLERWLGDTPERREILKDIPPDVLEGSRRRQALQILGLPEEFCLEPVADPNATFAMDVELLEVGEYKDLHGDGKTLLQVVREGRKPGSDAPVAGDLCSVSAHFRIAKLLMNLSLKDTRMGLANTSEGLVLAKDKSKEPVEFIVGEEDACGEGEFVPPCIGRCLAIPPGGVVEGMQFELILRDGVPISEMEKTISDAYADGTFNAAMPDTTGPVVVRIEVERVSPPAAGPGSSDWKGVASVAEERRRAEELQGMDGGRHAGKALKRWRRVLSWLRQTLEGRRWKLQGGAAAGDSLYDLEWDDEDEGAEPAGAEAPAKADAERARAAEAPEAASELSPFEVEDGLLRTFHDDELEEWAAAHSAAAQVLAGAGGAEADAELSRKHAECAVHACALGKVSKEVEVRGRSQLAACLLEAGDSARALEVLRAAQALDPSSAALRDQAARAAQSDGERQVRGLKEALPALKQALAAAVVAGDDAAMLRLLQELDSLPLTWDAVSEAAIGKEVGLCAKQAGAEVAEVAKALVGRFHKLAKEQRPLWVR